MVQILSSDFGVCEIPDPHLDDICTFFGISRHDCIERLETYRIADMGDAWTRADPQTPSDIKRFYAETQNYIWELSLWHHSAAYQPYLAEVSNAAAQSGRGGLGFKALDYGCGIGTTALLLAEAGFQVDICDVPGQTLAFAAHRLSRRGVRYNTVPVLDQVARLSSKYDLVVSIDVLEHTPFPDRVLRSMVRSLRCGGLAVITVPFAENDDRPYHLASVASRFAEGRWLLEFTRNGLKPAGRHTYRKVSAQWLPFFSLRYWVWRCTGMYLVVQHVPRPA